MKFDKIGNHIRQISNRNKDLSIKNVLGINIDKVFMPSVANTNETDLSNYKVVEKGQFATNLMHVGRDERLPIGVYIGEEPAIVSPAYFTFEVIDSDALLPEYLMLIFLQPEFDRYAGYICDSSVRGNLDWERFCEVEIAVPTPEKQREYVGIYGNLLKLSNNHERSFADLQLVTDTFMERLKSQHSPENIGDYIKEAGERNKDKLIKKQVGLENKDFVAPKVKVANDKRDTYKVLRKNQFACNLMHVGRDMRLPVGLYSDEGPAIISPAYKIFEISQPEKLLPEFLLLFFKRPETDRLMAYMTDSSVRQGLDWDRLCETRMPIPPMPTQKSIVAIHHALEARKRLAERLKTTTKKISPILIKDARDKVLGAVA